MQKIKCVVSYDGAHFYGFQIQPGKRTIHGEIEKALKIIHKGMHIRIQASGRTDRGVHAKGQVFHFETPFDLPESSWKRALNALLPVDIQIQEAKKVPSTFHSRFNAVEKEYRYYIWHDPVYDLFKRDHLYHFSYPLRIDKIQEACRYLEGEHDFTTFSSAKATVKGSRVRTIFHMSCEKNGSEIEFIIRGNGFLYNMARIIVGCLLDIGQEKRDPKDIPKLIEAKDRQLLGETAPPQGLYLWEVIYNQV